MSAMVRFRAMVFPILINIFIVDSAYALSVNYSYVGNNFVEISGEPDKFSTDDRVTAKFNIDCAVAHDAGDCVNLPFDNYFELGAVLLEPNSFSAGPASLPASDGSVVVNRLSFSTDSRAQIVAWDMDLGLDDPAGLINVDTDNSGDGLDSAAALGAFAQVMGQPGTWENDLPPVEGTSDIFVQKTVDNPAPAGPQQTVEFTVEVSNGGSGPAKDVVVVDKLPAELAIPEGMAVFTSTGVYDPASGHWDIGEIQVGVKQVMSIPAIIVTEPQPACVINLATAYLSVDRDGSNNWSSIALRRPDIERCVDLSVEVSDWYQASFPCEPEGKGEMVYQLKIHNGGTDQARNVVLEISETLYKAPGFSVDAPNCEGLRCNWATIAAGADEWVAVSTDGFQIQEPTEHAIRVVVTSDIEDYPIENNLLIDQHTMEPFLKSTCNRPDFDFDIGGGGGGCFIATATYGSHLHPHVQILREFRDSVLMNTQWGRKVVEFYYRHSPDLACYIAERDGLRMLTRGLLLPVVFTVAYPWQALLIFILIFALLYTALRIKQARPSS